jgi:hypothetical protein
MPQYEINFTAYVSDSIVIDFDGDIEDIDEMHVRANWGGLPLINGATYDWNSVDVESVVDLDENDSE